MSDIKGEISRRQLLKMASPLGRVTLEKARCTGCGLCALDCPTEALTIKLAETTESFRLLFEHKHCVACDRCVEVCPEKCLSVERTVDSGRLTGPPEVLFEDNLVRCRECQAPVGSRAMIDSVRAKLTAAGRSSLSYFDLCPDCKARVPFTGLKSR